MALDQAPPYLAALDGELAEVPGTVSVWYGAVGGSTAYARAADVTHYAASTMKVAVLAALYRSAEAGGVGPRSAGAGAQRIRLGGPGCRVVLVSAELRQRRLGVGPHWRLGHPALARRDE